jgi:flagellar basal-body rod protein FlgG
LKNIWVSVSGALAQQKNVETIANNVANANTPGFKKDQLVFKEYLTALDKGVEDIDLPNKEWKPKDFYKTYGAQNAYVKADGSYTNFQQGQLTPTSNPLDLALRGKGFFEVLTPNGTRYTRRGLFTVNNQGNLVTDQGYAVLNKMDWAALKTEGAKNLTVPKPEERKISIGGGNVTVNMQGEVYQQGKKIGDLSVVEFKDMHTLKKEGNSLYINSEKDNIENSTKTVVNQGFIEESNVNAVLEMSELIKANRQFESIQKAMKAYDSITGKSVNDIARF